MNTTKTYEVIIVGGSYAGLSAALTLGRALRKVLVIDSGNPCNSVVAHSHNFLTHDGEAPAAIARTAREQLSRYTNVEFLSADVTSIASRSGTYSALTSQGQTYISSKLIFATGITDLLPPIPGFKDCWGKTVLHCPYCHGYEVQGVTTGVLATTEQSFDFVMLIAHWTKNVYVLTNGASPFNEEQMVILNKHHITVYNQPFDKLNHLDGQLQTVQFRDQSTLYMDVLYARLPFIQKTILPQQLGCQIDEQGYIVTDSAGKTNVAGIYACGDNASKQRTISNAVAMGTNSGMALNKELIVESYQQTK